VQVRAHVFHLHQQFGDFILAADRHALGDVARRNRLGGVVCGLEAVAHAAQQRHRQQRGRQTAQQHAQHEHQDAEVVALGRRLVGHVRLGDLQALEGADQGHQHVTLLAPQGQEARHLLAAEVAVLHATHNLAQLGVPGVLRTDGLREHFLFHGLGDDLGQLLLPLHALVEVVPDQLQVAGRGVVVQGRQGVVGGVLERQQGLHAHLRHAFVDRVGQQDALQRLVVQGTQAIPRAHQAIPAHADDHRHRCEVTEKDQHVPLCQTQGIEARHLVCLYQIATL